MGGRTVGGGGAESSQAVDKTDRHPTGGPGGEKKGIHGEGGEPPPLTEEGKRRGQQGGVLPLLKVPAKKNSSFTRVRPPGRSWEKNGTPRGKNSHHNGKPPRPGEPGSGPRTEKAPVHTGGTRSPHFGQGPGGLLQGNPGFGPPRESHLASRFPPRTGSLDQTSSPVRRPEHQTAAQKTEGLRGSVQGGGKGKPGGEEGLLSPSPGSDPSKSGTGPQETVSRATHGNKPPVKTPLQTNDGGIGAR
ncbi:hypothetical protein GWK47_019444 [Chionoecetes opilio]|uniref:Uncharacterized protein n=1 Tax=Chionoecetes opilio TaxID=41210 RepID=A0A8J5CIV0_CHIOP|nr:hypothetical protein GWK47_019444 [Chionoecetes opilio]